jgi:ABC-type sugar transport system substrate-binding protein
MAQAEALVKHYSAPITSVGDTQPTSRKPPTGKTIVYARCQLPSCTYYSDGIHAAAKVLGWKVTDLTFDNTTPQADQAVLTQAIALHPNAIIDGGVDPAIDQQQRKAAKAAGIQFVDFSNAYTTSDAPAPTALVQSPTLAALWDSILPAAWAATQTKGHVAALFTGDPSYAIFEDDLPAFKGTLTAICPKTCRTYSLVTPAAGVGTTVPGQIVSALQAHPNVNYLVLQDGNWIYGVPAAMKAAGLTNVKIIMGDPTQPTFDGMASGDNEVMGVATPNILTGWKAVDDLAHYYTGGLSHWVSTGPQDHSPVADSPLRIFTQSDAPASAEFNEPSNYASIFKKLWHISG